MFCSCFPFRDFVSGEILESERIKDRREEDYKGRGKLVYTGEAMKRDEFRLYIGGFVMAKDSCGCATICEYWDGVAEEGDDDRKGTRVVDKVNVSFVKAISGGNYDIERKLARGYIMSRCSTCGATISSAWNETADHIPIYRD